MTQSELKDDAEISAIRAAVSALDPLDPGSRARVIEYLTKRFLSPLGGGTEAGPRPEPDLLTPRPSHVGQAASRVGAPGHIASPVGSSAYQRFLTRYHLTESKVVEVVDIKQHEVHNLSPWSGPVEMTRRLAAMLSLCQLAENGVFAVAQSDLAKAAKQHGIYNADSTSTYLRRCKYKGSVVFSRSRSSEDWRLTPAGQEYAAESLRQVLDQAA